MIDAHVPSTWCSFFVSSGQPVWRIVTRVPPSTSSSVHVTTVNGSSRVVTRWVCESRRGGSISITRPTMNTRVPSSDL